jgi:S1-C subfamily serine protease
VRLYAESAAGGRKVERPWIGAKLEAMSHEIAEGLGLNRVSGAVVTRLYDKGPAAAAGVQAGDVITHVDGVEVVDARAVYYRLTTKGIGQTARLTVLRSNKSVDVNLPLIGAPKPGKDDAKNLSGNHPLDGARISNILPSVADELGLDQSEGVVVTSVRDGSTAQTFGFQPGDVIAAIGKDQIANVDDVEKALATRKRLWQISVKRGERVLQLQVPG